MERWVWRLLPPAVAAVAAFYVFSALVFHYINLYAFILWAVLPVVLVFGWVFDRRRLRRVLVMNDELIEMNAHLLDELVPSPGGQGE